MTTRALIIGPGYLGDRVARRWREQGLRVFATTRKEERARQLLSSGIEPIITDVLSPDADPLPTVDVVFWSVGYDRSAGVSQRDVYVNGLATMLDRLPKPEVLIYSSSTGVYGDAGGNWLDENSPADPIDESGANCLAAEQVLRDWSNRRDIAHNESSSTNPSGAQKTRIVILRFGGLYGPGRMIGLDQLRAGRPVSGDSSGYLNLIHVDDAARVVDSARLSKPSQPVELYIVTDGNPVTRSEFYGELARRLGTAAPRFDPAGARRHRGNRRFRADKMLSELCPDLKHPDFRSGIASILPA